MVLERTRHSLKSYSLAAIATNPRIMNREIKFRGKVKGRNEWKYGSLLPYADGECNIITETGRRIDTGMLTRKPWGNTQGLKMLMEKIFTRVILSFSNQTLAINTIIKDRYSTKTGSGVAYLLATMIMALCQ